MAFESKKTKGRPERMAVPGERKRRERATVNSIESCQREKKKREMTKFRKKQKTV